jgi:hypothetical protein
LDDGLDWHSAGTRATLFIEKIQDFAQSIRVRGVPEISALAADVDEADLLQFLEMMRKRRSRDAEFLLHFPGNHPVRVSGEEKPQNLQARLRAKSGEAIGRPGDDERIGFAHISMIAEIWKHVNFSLVPNSFRGPRILIPGEPKLWKRHAFGF